MRTRIKRLTLSSSSYGQAKLVRCGRGRIYDVAVDIRENSETFGQYVKVELSEENKHMLFIPEGFAHGFVVLSDEENFFTKLVENMRHKLIEEFCGTTKI